MNSLFILALLIALISIGNTFRLTNQLFGNGLTNEYGTLSALSALGALSGLTNPTGLTRGKWFKRGFRSNKVNLRHRLNPVFAVNGLDQFGYDPSQALAATLADTIKQEALVTQYDPKLYTNNINLAPGGYVMQPTPENGWITDGQPSSSPFPFNTDYQRWKNSFGREEGLNGCNGYNCNENSAAFTNDVSAEWY